MYSIRAVHARHLPQGDGEEFGCVTRNVRFGSNAVQLGMSALCHKRTNSVAQRNDAKCQKLEKAEDCRNK